MPKRGSRTLEGSPVPCPAPSRGNASLGEEPAGRSPGAWPSGTPVSPPLLSGSWPRLLLPMTPESHPRPLLQRVHLDAFLKESALFLKRTMGPGLGCCRFNAPPSRAHLSEVFLRTWPVPRALLPVTRTLARTRGSRRSAGPVLRTPQLRLSPARTALRRAGRAGRGPRPRLLPPAGAREHLCLRVSQTRLAVEGFLIA